MVKKKDYEAIADIEGAVCKIVNRFSPILDGKYSKEVLCEIIGNLVKEVRKEIAKEILTKVGNLTDDGDDRFHLRDYQWFVNLCKEYDVEVEE